MKNKLRDSTYENLIFNQILILNINSNIRFKHIENKMQKRTKLTTIHCTDRSETTAITSFSKIENRKRQETNGSPGRDRIGQQNVNRHHSSYQANIIYPHKGVGCALTNCGACVSAGSAEHGLINSKHKSNQSNDAIDRARPP